MIVASADLLHAEPLSPPFGVIPQPVRSRRAVTIGGHIGEIGSISRFRVAGQNTVSSNHSHNRSNMCVLYMYSLVHILRKLLATPASAHYGTPTWMEEEAWPQLFGCERKSERRD